MPLFVVTHHEREPLELSDTTFNFVTDGIESALDQAREAAGARTFVGGGAEIITSTWPPGCRRARDQRGPRSWLGSGERLLDGVGDLKLEQVRAVEAPGVTTSSTA